MDKEKRWHSNIELDDASSKAFLKLSMIESTRRSFAYIQEAGVLGEKTLLELAEQGEKIRRIDDSLDLVNGSLKETKKHLNFLKHGTFRKFFGNVFTLKRKKEKISLPALQSRGNLITTTRKSISRSHNDIRTERDTDEVENNLGLMSESLLHLKTLAQDLNLEMSAQNQIIFSLANKFDESNGNLMEQSSDMRKMVHKR